MSKYKNKKIKYNLSHHNIVNILKEFNYEDSDIGRVKNLMQLFDVYTTDKFNNIIATFGTEHYGIYLIYNMQNMCFQIYLIDQYKNKCLIVDKDLQNMPYSDIIKIENKVKSILQKLEEIKDI